MCFAWWALLNPKKINICVRFRITSFWWYAVIIGAAAIAHIFYTISENYDRYHTFKMVLAEASVALIVLLTDYHWCRVLKFYGESLTDTDTEELVTENSLANEAEDLEAQEDFSSDSKESVPRSE